MSKTYDYSDKTQLAIILYPRPLKRNWRISSLCLSVKSSPPFSAKLRNFWIPTRATPSAKPITRKTGKTGRFHSFFHENRLFRMRKLTKLRKPDRAVGFKDRATKSAK